MSIKVGDEVEWLSEYSTEKFPNSMDQAISTLEQAISTGLRDNKEKTRWRNVPLFLFEPVIKVGQFGEKKYATYNYLKGLGLNDTLDALKRHLMKFESPYESDNDEESLQNHLAHVAWNAIVALHMLNTRPELDDRYKLDKKGPA
jgi:Domain of unknown function (DUF5664)